MSKATCSVDGCREAVYARGLCESDYGKAYRRGELPPKQLELGVHYLSNVDLEAMTGDCAVCGPSVPVSVRIRSRGGQRTWRAVECMAKRRDRHGPRSQKNYPGAPATSDARRRWRLKARYGLTEDDYERMFAEQRGCCAICGTSHPQLVIDHDHATGAVRGLLCSLCNTGIGHLRDDRGRVEQAAEYLKRHGSAAA